MTNKEKNKLAANLIQFIMHLNSENTSEDVANNAIDLVNSLIEDFTDVGDEVDYYMNSVADWDNTISYLTMRKDFKNR